MIRLRLRVLGEKNPQLQRHSGHSISRVHTINTSYPVHPDPDHLSDEVFARYYPGEVICSSPAPATRGPRHPRPPLFSGRKSLLTAHAQSRKSGYTHLKYLYKVFGILLHRRFIYTSAFIYSIWQLIYTQMYIELHVLII